MVEIIKIKALETIEIERHKRLEALKNEGIALDHNLKEFSAILDSKVFLEIKEAWEFACDIDYEHDGLSKNVYLQHPYRVAQLYTKLVSNLKPEGIKLAFLHNVFEVSTISKDNLTKIFNIDISDAIAVLTVDRTRQWDWSYKSKYYRDISKSHIYVKQIKIIDKLDNLFLLCLNPSDEIREKYLYEITRWILPMIQNHLPDIESYVKMLIDNNLELGHLEIH